MARVAFHYGMPYPEVLKLPLRTFWSFNRQVDRLRAEAETRWLRLLNASESPESSKMLAESLRNEIASPVRVVKKFDEAKFKDLQKMFSQGV